MFVPVACRENTDNIDLQAMLLMSESRWANLAIEDNAELLEAVAAACDTPSLLCRRRRDRL